MTNSVVLKIITPEQLFYEGDVDSVMVKTLDGYEGFMANHSYACVLLDEGKVKIKEAGSDLFKTALTGSGYMDVKDTFVIFVDEAQWVE